MAQATVRIRKPDKTLFAGGFTKGQLADYYRAVAPAILPQLAGRPVTRIRFPDGPRGERFFEKNTPRYAPHWLRRRGLSASPGRAKPAKTVVYPFVDDVAGLEWMANQAAVELHTPQWRVGPRGGIRKPDRLVIDLDPGEGAGLDQCARAAHLVRERLGRDGLAAWPVTSGGKGIHLYAALDGRHTALAVHAFVRALARELAAAHPGLLTAVIGKEHRVGRVFLDWSQNHPARSTATPYTLRAKGPGPTVAAPRDWEEVQPGIVQLAPEDVRARLERDGDRMARWGLVP